MNEKKLQKSYAFRLLAATVLFGLCLTMVSEPVSAKGRLWGIGIIIQTESGIVEQDDEIVFSLTIADVGGEVRKFLMTNVKVFKGDTKCMIRDRIINHLNKFEELKAEPDRVLGLLGIKVNFLWVEVNDNYKESTFLSIDNIIYQTIAKNQNDAFQVRLIIFDP